MTVVVTPAALDVVRRVQQARHAASWVFVFGEGCCEGTAPHLFADHHVGPTQQEVGRAGDVPIFADTHVHDMYAGRTATIDVIEDSVANGFSAEVALGYRFILR